MTSSEARAVNTLIDWLLREPHEILFPPIEEVTSAGLVLVSAAESSLRGGWTAARFLEELERQKHGVLSRFAIA